MTRLSNVVWAAALLPLGPLGCSSSSSSSASAPSSGALVVGSATPVPCADSGGSPVVWTDDGVLRCASTAEATLGSATFPTDGGEVVDALDIVVTQPNTLDVFSIVVTGPAPLGGTYTCTSALKNAQFNYDEVGVYSATPTSCTVTLALSDDGTAATGTFSVTLNVVDGGAKTLSNGTFNVPVTGG